MIRFHLDEHIDGAVADALVRAGIDVTTPALADLISADDEEHLVFALQEGRVTVTHDDDYLALDAAGAKHAGIAYCHQLKYSIGQLAEMLTILATCYTPEDMEGRVEFL